MRVKSNKRVNYTHFLLASNEVMKANRETYKNIIKEKISIQKSTKYFQILKSILNIEYNLLKIQHSIEVLKYYIYVYDAIKDKINNEKERKNIITKIIHHYLFIRFFALKIINDSKKEINKFKSLLNKDSKLTKYYILPHIKKIEYLSNIVENKLKEKFKKLESSCIRIILEERLSRNQPKKDIILLNAIEILLIFFKNRLKQETFNLEEGIKNEIDNILQKLEILNECSPDKIKEEFSSITKKLKSYPKLKEMLLSLYRNIISRRVLIEHNKNLNPVKIKN